MLCELCQPRELRGRYCTLRRATSSDYRDCTLHGASQCMCFYKMRGIILSNKVSQYEEVEANQSPSSPWR